MWNQQFTQSVHILYIQNVDKCNVKQKNGQELNFFFNSAMVF